MQSHGPWSCTRNQGGKGVTVPKLVGASTVPHSPLPTVWGGEASPELA